MCTTTTANAMIANMIRRSEQKAAALKANLPKTETPAETNGGETKAPNVKKQKKKPKRKVEIDLFKYGQHLIKETRARFGATIISIMNKYWKEKDGEELIYFHILTYPGNDPILSAGDSEYVTMVFVSLKEDKGTIYAAWSDQDEGVYARLAGRQNGQYFMFHEAAWKKSASFDPALTAFVDIGMLKEVHYCQFDWKTGKLTGMVTM
jgi:hypothetical protein